MSFIFVVREGQPGVNSNGVADVKPTAIEEKPPRAILDAVLLGLSIFLWALFGIYTREAGTLASLWPANAFLLAMLVRFPSLATRYAFPAALLGYFAADLLTGGTLLSTTILTLANLAGVALGYFLLSRMQEDDRHLRRPQSVLLLMLILAASSAAAGCVGAFANKILFERGMIGGFFWWFVTEFVNYVAIVPVILTIPHGFRLRGERRRLRIPSPSLTRLAPVLAFLLSAAASVAVGGPGALAFPVPALLWCAVTYGLFGTSVLTFLFSVWTLLGIANGVLHVAPDADRDTISLRLAVMLVALAPLMVASIFEARNRLIEQLRYRAAHDDMTGVLNRVAFFEQARQMLASANREAQPFVVLMLDLDRFKSINDTHGHEIGDRILTSFADCLRSCLRKKDIYGRIGGEEFAALLPDCGRAEAELVAGRIIDTFSRAQFDLETVSINATVSIGFAVRDAGQTLEALLSTADRALYLAKNAGRNRAEYAESRLQ